MIFALILYTLQVFSRDTVPTKSVVNPQVCSKIQKMTGYKEKILSGIQSSFPDDTCTLQKVKESMQTQEFFNSYRYFVWYRLSYLSAIARKSNQKGENDEKEKTNGKGDDCNVDCINAIASMWVYYNNLESIIISVLLDQKSTHNMVQFFQYLYNIRMNMLDTVELMNLPYTKVSDIERFKSILLTNVEEQTEYFEGLSRHYLDKVDALLIECDIFMAESQKDNVSGLQSNSINVCGDLQLSNNDAANSPPGDSNKCNEESCMESTDLTDESNTESTDVFYELEAESMDVAEERNTKILDVAEELNTESLDVVEKLQRKDVDIADQSQSKIIETFSRIFRFFGC